MSDKILVKQNTKGQFCINYSTFSLRGEFAEEQLKILSLEADGQLIVGDNQEKFSDGSGNKIEVRKIKEAYQFSLSSGGDESSTVWSFKVFPALRTIEANCIFQEVFKSQAAEGDRNEANKAFDTLEAEESSSGFDRNILFATISIPQNHLSLCAYRLHDITDHFDYLVEEKRYQTGHRSEAGFSGNLISLENNVLNKGLLLGRMGPTPEANFTKRVPHDFYWKDRVGLAVYGRGTDESIEGFELESYPLCLTWGPSADLPRLFREYYRSNMQPEVLKNKISLANTWGDRNQDKTLKEAFVLEEMSALQVSGIDGLMLDDGCQKGTTQNSALNPSGLWEGYHNADPDFWTLHSEKFPGGFGALLDASQLNKKHLALWFSPDSSNDFENWEKDAEILSSLYREKGVRYFKLDGIKFRTRAGESNFGKFLKRLQEVSSGEIVPVLDVTSEIRQGFFREVEHGILFLENRYTDWGNYYPYRTLRNVWQLSRWIPLQRLHIEFLNPDRNEHKYEGDPLAPSRYSISYLFAVTMLGHPLAWMEVQHLNDERKQELAEVIHWCKTVEKDWLNADIEPIGELPNGVSWSGFVVHSKEKTGILLFRDLTQETTFSFSLEDSVLKSPALEARIAFSDDTNASCRMENCHLIVEIPHPQCWAFIEFNETSK